MMVEAMRSPEGFTVRPMRPADLDAVEAINEAAFGAVLQDLFGARPPRVFSSEMVAVRLARDPAGCFVAEESGHLLGSLLSVHWGSLGWFGPLAVVPDRQNR